MSRLNLNLQTVESCVFFSNAVKPRYFGYKQYKKVEGSTSWMVYTELVPELVLTYEVEKNTDEEVVFLAEKSQLAAWDPRKRVDVLTTAGPHNHIGYEEAIQTILKDLDGYHPDVTGQEHYHQHSEALQSILKDLDGYAEQDDLDGLNQTVSEHYHQHSDVLTVIINSLDGYSTELGLDNTVSEHYRQHSEAIQTILKDLDGYIPTTEKGAVNGVATLDAGGKIPVGQIPATALPEVHVVADATARLALTVQEGDEAIQLDDGTHWIYDGSTWYIRPVSPHATDHSEGGADEIIAQNLGSGSATAGQIMVADGSGGWGVEDNSAGNSLHGGLFTCSFVKNGVSVNAWLSLYEGMNYSNESQSVIPWKSKLVGITFTNDVYNADATIEVHKSAAGSGNSHSIAYSLVLTGCRVAYITNLTNITFNPGDKVAVYHNKTGSTNSQDVGVTLYFQVASDATNGSGSESFSGNF